MTPTPRTHWTVEHPEVPARLVVAAHRGRSKRARPRGRKAFNRASCRTHAGVLGCDREAAPSVYRGRVDGAEGEEPREAVQARGRVGTQNLDIQAGA